MVWSFAATVYGLGCATPEDAESETEVEDLLVPTVTIVAPTAGAVLSGLVTLDVDVDDDVGATAMQLEVDGAAILVVTEEPLVLSWDTTTAANGEHDLRVQAADRVGHVGEASVVVTVQNGDADPAHIAITTPPAGALTCGEIPASVYVSEPATQVRLVVDRHEFTPQEGAPFDWTIDTTRRDDGVHTIYATADLASGGSITDRIEFTIDNSGGDCNAWPMITLAEPDAFEYVGAEKDVEIVVTDDDALADLPVVFSVGGVTAWEGHAGEAAAFTWSTEAVEEGTHEVVAAVVDPAGQRSEARASVTIDRTPPSAWFLSPASGDQVSGTVGIEGSAEDENGIVRATFRVGGREAQELTEPPWTWTWEAGREYGEVNLEFAARDPAGNWTDHDIVVYVNDAPEVTWVDPRDGETVSGRVTLEVDVDDEATPESVTFEVDGVFAYEDTRSRYTYALDTCEITPGDHVLAATAEDELGFFGSAEITVTVEQPLVADLAAIATVRDPAQAFSVEVEADEAIASVSFALDGSPLPGTVVGVATPGRCAGVCDDLCSTYTLDADLSDLDSGAYLLEVTVTTASGDVATDLASLEVERDADADGEEAVAWGGADCDDDDDAVSPAASESCNDVDDDCDGLVDEDFDADGDGFADAAACSYGEDCDDTDPEVNPDATEVCDGIDNDCDGYVDLASGLTTDEGEFADGTINVSASNELRGNVYQPTKDMTLLSFEVDIDPGTRATTYSVYESDSETGTYTLLASSSVSRTGGDGWYASGDLDVELEGGRYYLLAVGSTDSQETRQDRAPSLAEAAELLPIGASRDTSGAQPASTDEDPVGTRLYNQRVQVEYVDDANIDDDGDGQTEYCGDCDDTNATVYEGATEVCDGIDGDCDGLLPADEVDADGDGDRVCDADCDDADPLRFPSSFELCDGIDNDCDGLVAEDEVDADGDGVPACLDCSGATCVMDCDDADPSITTPTWYADLDGDGYGDDATATTECPPPSGYITVGGDCDDADADVSPGEPEVCDAVDNDCDGAADDGYDADGDGYGDCLDCDDSDPSANPSEVEVCGNSVDEDCDGSAPQCRYGGETGLVDASYVFFGSASGDGAGSRACAGDVDGDGYVDVLVSGYTADSPSTDAGNAWLVYGPHAAAVSLGGSEIVELRGESSGDYLGYSASLGDLDGDTLLDIVLGATSDDDGGAAAGAVYVIPSTTLATGSVAGLGAKLLGDAANDNFGAAVDAGGDLDDDGDTDVVVAAPGNDGSGSGSGAVYLFAGPVTSDLEAADADALLEGNRAGDTVGAGLATIGDLDGDGADDLLVGATAEDTGGSSAGAVYLVLGPVGSMAMADADALLAGANTYDGVGAALAGAGDVDGDGTVDILVGSSASDPGGNASAGSAYVVLGVPSGTVSLDDADATFTGVAAGDYLGYSVAGPGDIDDDGYADLVIGASGDDTSASAAGAAYLWYGPASGTEDASFADAVFTGENASDAAGAFVGSAGDLDGDGLPDFLVGAAAADLVATGSGAAYAMVGAP